jgi:glycosyltransferase involved in cell wall biosynthesis
VRDGRTGVIAKKNSPEGLADAILAVLSLKEEYAKMCHTAWEWSKEISFKNAYSQLRQKLITKQESHIAVLSTFLGENLGGAEESIKLLCGVLNKHDHVIVYSTRAGLINRNLGFHVARIKFTSLLPRRVLILGSTFLDYYIAIILFFTLRNTKALLVQDLYSLCAATIVARWKKLPLIVTIRDPLPKVIPKGDFPIMLMWALSILMKIRNQSWKKAILKANYVIAVSHYIASNINIYIEGAISPAVIYNAPPQIDNLKAKELNPVPTFLFAGRLSADKGADILPCIFNQLQDISCNIIVAGDGPYFDLVNSAAEKLKNRNLCVQVLGRVSIEEINNLYPICDGVLLLSRYPEPLSRVLIEAGMWKKPVFAFSTGGTPEIIKDRVNGLLFNVGDYRSLTSSLRYYIQNRDELKKMGENNYEIVKCKFNAENTARQYINIVNSCTS